MHSERDTTRIVRSWLHTDEHESADRVLDDVLALLDTNTQRLPWWPARRIADMNNAVKVAFAAAAVVVVAVVGINLLSAPGGVGGSGPSVSPFRSPTPPPSPSPTPWPTLAAVFPPEGGLAIGRHELTVEGVPLSVNVTTPGWSSSGLNASRTGGSISKGTTGTPDGAIIAFWSPDGVYADPCAHVPSPPAPGFARLARAAATVPGIDVVAEPSFAFVDALPAMHMVLTVNEDIACDPQELFLWYDEEEGPRSASARGSTISAWDVDTDYLTPFAGYDGVRIWFEAQTFQGASPAIEQDIQQIIDSILFSCPIRQEVTICR